MGKGRRRCSNRETSTVERLLLKENFCVVFPLRRSGGHVTEIAKSKLCKQNGGKRGVRNKLAALVNVLFHSFKLNHVGIFQPGKLFCGYKTI